MFRLLIRKELQNHVLSARFIFSFVIVLMIMLGSAAVQIGDYTERMLDDSANRTATRRALSDARYWWHLQWTGVQVVRPSSALGMLAVGAEKNPDSVARVFSRSKPLIQFTGSPDRNPLFSMFPVVDIVFTTGIVLSLIAIVLSFDSISGEREDGTLKLLLSFPVPRSTLILAKWVGGCLTLFLPFITGYMCIAIAFLLSPNVTLGVSEWMAFFAIGLASLLYMAWCFSASLLVSCWCRKSATAMTILLFFWVLVVLVIPNISPHVSAALVPATSLQSAQFQANKAAKEIQAQEQEAYRELEKKYKLRRWWQKEQSWQEGIDIATASYNKQRDVARTILDERQAAVREQTGYARSMGRVSPLACYAHIATAFAWTGIEFREHLERFLRDYEDRIRRVTSQSMKDHSAYSHESIPTFNYTPPPLGKRFASTLMEWSVLISGTVILFLAAFVSFVRRDVI